MKNAVEKLSISVIFATQLTGCVSAATDRSTIENTPKMHLVEISVIPEKSKITPPAVAFSADSNYIAVRTIDNRIDVWDWKSRRLVTSLYLPFAAGDSGVSEPMQFDPSGKYFVSCHTPSKDKSGVTIWSTATWQVIHEIKDSVPGGGCSAVNFTSDGKHLVRFIDRITGAKLDALYVYDVNTWNLIDSTKTDVALGLLMSISPDDKYIAVAGSDFVDKDNQPVVQGKTNIFDIRQRPKLQIYSFDNLKSIREILLEQPVTSFGRLRWASNSRIAHSSGGNFQVYDISSARKVQEISPEHVINKGAFDYLEGGAFVVRTFGRPSEIEIRNASLDQIVSKIGGGGEALAVSKNGKYMAVTTVGSTKIYQIR